MVFFFSLPLYTKQRDVLGCSLTMQMRTVLGKEPGSQKRMWSKIWCIPDHSFQDFFTSKKWTSAFLNPLHFGVLCYSSLTFTSTTAQTLWKIWEYQEWILAPCGIGNDLKYNIHHLHPLLLFSRSVMSNSFRPHVLQEGGPLPGPETGLLSNTRKLIFQGDTCADKARDFIGKGTRVESSR